MQLTSVCGASALPVLLPLLDGALGAAGDDRWAAREAACLASAPRDARVCIVRGGTILLRSWSHCGGLHVADGPPHAGPTPTPRRIVL